MSAQPGEIIVNENGGAQSAIHGAPHLIPAEALLRLNRVVGDGSKTYAPNNWRRIPFEQHISHALEHLFLMMDGDDTDDHLGHALTRLAFAVAMEPEAKFDFKAYVPLPGSH